MTDPDRLTPVSKYILDLALGEALQLGHNLIGPEHLLLALVRNNNVASQVLTDDMGHTSKEISGAIIRHLAKLQSVPTPHGPPPGWYYAGSLIDVLSKYEADTPVTIIDGHVYGTTDFNKPTRKEP